MEKLSKKKATIKRQLTRIKNDVNTTGKNMEFDSLTARLEKVKELYHMFIQVEDAVFELDPEQASEMEAIDDNYFEIVSKLQCLIREKSLNTGIPIQSSEASLNNTMAANVHSDFKLPRLSLPFFDGNLKEWQSFYDIFTSTVHENTSLSGAQKFKYLKGQLKGPALDLIRHFRVDDNNYFEAFQRLVKRYDKKKPIVENFIREFLNLPKITKASSSGITKLHDGVDETIRGLKALGKDAETRDPWLIYIALEKLDEETRRLWRYESADDDFPLLNEFLDFLMKRMDSLMDVATKPTVTKPQSNSKSFHNISSLPECPLCTGQSHRLCDCTTFRNMNITKRRDFIKNQSRCFNCLSDKHSVLQCANRNRCQKPRCGKKHNSLLHPDNECSQPSSNTEVLPSSDNRNISSHSSTQSFLTNSMVQDEVHMSSMLPRCNRVSTNASQGKILPTALIQVRDSIGHWHNVRALLDSASTHSFVTKSCVDWLHLPRKHVKCSISTLNDTQAGSSNAITNITIRSMLDHRYVRDVKALVLPLITSDIPSEPIDVSQFKYLSELQFADPTFAEPGQIDVLLGCDQFFMCLRDGQIFENSALPIAQNTQFGWIIGGNFDAHQHDANTMLALPFNETNIEKILRRFWEIEELPIQNTLTDAEQYCLNRFHETTSHDERTCKITTSLPYKCFPPNIGDSYTHALRRFYSLEKKLQSDVKLKEAYIKFIEEYEELGHLEAVPSVEIPKPANQIYYLPHHGVIKESSTTTKLRVVFDASAKSRSGMSLNDNLHVGPKLQENLVEILLRFRKHQFVFSADLEKMFRQIWVSKHDVDFQRILWRKNPSEEIKHYRLLTVTYGTAPASFLATRALQFIADKYSTKFPSAAKVLVEDFYMDDLMSGSNDLHEAKILQHDLQVLLKLGGFHLRKWSTNHPQLLSNIPEADREITTLDLNDGTAMVSILGIRYHPEIDIFSFKVQLPDVTRFTKRSLLSEISRIYDPMGLISPVTIAMKMLFQQLWLDKLEWEDELPDDIKIRWLHYRNDLHVLQSFRIPRWIYTIDVFELHGFADSSKDAYAAAIYCRSVNKDGTVKTNLIASKTRVAPIKTITIPRLELCAAVLLTKLLVTLMNSIKLEDVPPIHLYTDSSTVLDWLSKPPRSWPTFIANRTSEILSISNRGQWKHVPSAQNPADCASRGMLPSDLLNFKLWWNGPDWLSTHPIQYPKQKVDAINPEVQPEIEINTLTARTSDQHSILSRLIERHSSFRTITNVVAYLRRPFLRPMLPSKLLDIGEVTKAQHQIFQWVQHDAFSKELSLLKQKTPIASSSKILSFSPFIDGNGLLRSTGRLENADVNYDAKHPIILPEHHPITEMIVRQTHNQFLHIGPTQMLFELRQKYAIPRMKNLINRIIHECFICRRHKAKTQQQLMGQLPRCRVHLIRPFLHTGVDFAGPFAMKAHKGRGAKQFKSYLVVFVCMATKAVHLEITTDLSTDTFIAALKRFQSTRGVCSDVYSDNGTNFTGANRQLKELSLLFDEEVSREKISAWSTSQGIKWHFIPPAAPSFGGLWEAVVKSTKFHLRRVVGNQILTYEEFLTLAKQIEAILNSRPISELSADVIDPLTPGHFILGHSLTMVPEPNLSHLPVPRLSRWQLIQQMTQSFWSRFHNEYMLSLNSMQKHHNINQNFIEGGLALVRDENTPPCKWPLARIIKLHPGKDNLTRVVTLKTANQTEVKRPISKLCLLPKIDSCESRGPICSMSIPEHTNVHQNF